MLVSWWLVRAGADEGIGLAFSGDCCQLDRRLPYLASSSGVDINVVTTCPNELRFADPRSLGLRGVTGESGLVDVRLAMEGDVCLLVFWPAVCGLLPLAADSRDVALLAEPRRVSCGVEEVEERGSVCDCTAALLLLLVLRTGVSPLVTDLSMVVGGKVFLFLLRSAVPPLEEAAVDDASSPSPVTVARL